MYDANKVKVEALIDIEGFKKGSQFMMKKSLLPMFQDRVKLVTETKQVKKKKTKEVKNPSTK